MTLTGCKFVRVPAGSSSASGGASSSASASASSSAETSGSAKLTTGEFRENTYYNDYFGLSFTVPDDWKIATRDQIDQIFGAAMDAMAGEEGLESAADLAEQQVLYLAVASKYELGTAPNPNVNLGAENLSGAEDVVQSPGDYLQIVMGQLEGAAVDYTFDGISTATHSGAEFATMNMTMEYEGTTTYQTQLCTIVKGYALVFTFTYYQEDEMNEMGGIADTIALY